MASTMSGVLKYLEGPHGGSSREMRRPMWIPICILVLILPLLDCRTAAPLIGAEAIPARATVAGRVTGPMGSDPVAGRLVSAVDVTTAARYWTTTSVTGGFTLLVPPGRYRLNVALARAERLVEEPRVLDLDPGAFVDDADFVLGGAGIASDR
jgi:hypothetical protein